MIVTVLLLLGGLLAQAQTQPAPPTVGATYKNIQVFTDLKNAPTTELIGSMQFMSGSLGVSCNFCHVSEQGPFESDANERKLKARDMIRMVRTLNANAFAGHQTVTCYTCHRGSPRPAATPVPWYKTPDEIAAYKASGSTKPSAPAAAPALPTVEQVFDRYRQAVGATALKTLRLVGVNTVAMSGSSVPFEADAVFPDKFAIVAKTAGGAVQNVLSGAQAWRRVGTTTTPLSAAQAAGLRTNADVVIAPVKFATSSASRTVPAIEQVGDTRYYVVQSQLATGIQRLYFDAQSGLLYKVHTEVTTPLGNRVEERTFEDYRTVQQVTLPFLIRNHYMEDQSEFRITTAEINVPLDSGLFEGNGGS